MKMARQMTLIREARYRCNLSQSVSGTQELLCPIDSQLRLVSVRRYTDLTREEPVQVERAEIYEGGEVGQGNGF